MSEPTSVIKVCSGDIYEVKLFEDDCRVWINDKPMADTEEHHNIIAILVYEALDLKEKLNRLEDENVELCKAINQLKENER